jgi:hypothetical protein
MRVLIATATKPKAMDNFTELCSLFRAAAVEGGLRIPEGILWTSGPGCTNLAFDVEGDEDVAERFIKAITMQLMPAKWTTTKDSLPEFDTCNVGFLN